jgi:hypothetical protein
VVKLEGLNDEQYEIVCARVAAIAPILDAVSKRGWYRKVAIPCKACNKGILRYRRYTEADGVVTAYLNCSTPGCICSHKRIPKLRRITTTFETLEDLDPRYHVQSDYDGSFPDVIQELKTRSKCSDLIDHKTGGAVTIRYSRRIRSLFKAIRRAQV